MPNAVLVFSVVTQPSRLPVLWESDGLALVRLGALLRRGRVLLEVGGTVGGLGWCGGLKHLMGLWGPGGLVGLGVVSSWAESDLADTTILPFSWKSANAKKHTDFTNSTSLTNHSISCKALH